MRHMTGTTDFTTPPNPTSDDIDNSAKNTGDHMQHLGLAGPPSMGKPASVDDYAFMIPSSESHSAMPSKASMASAHVDVAILNDERELVTA